MMRMGKGRVKPRINGYNSTIASKIKRHYLAFVFSRQYFVPSKDRQQVRTLEKKK
jgi:hypothetical protein